MSVKLSGRLQDNSITDALSISVKNVRLQHVFNKQYICLKDKSNLIFTVMVSYFIFVTHQYYSRSNYTKSPGSGVGNVNEPSLASHLRRESAKSLSRRPFCFCSNRTGGVNILLLT